jgi:hypothetical protein
MWWVGEPNERKKVRKQERKKDGKKEGIYILNGNGGGEGC